MPAMSAGKKPPFIACVCVYVCVCVCVQCIGGCAVRCGGQCLGNIISAFTGYHYCYGTHQCTDDIPHTNHDIPVMHSTPKCTDCVLPLH